MTWNGSTQAWGNAAGFTFSSTTPHAHVRTSAVNSTGSFRVHYAYDDNGTLVTRYIDSPYTSWSASKLVCSCSNVFGAHFTHVSGSRTTEQLILFYSLNYLQLYSVNATDNENWGPVQLELLNGADADHDGDCDTGCYDANYPTSASTV